MKFDNRLAFINMHLFDGQAGRLFENKSVLVEEGTIISVEDGNAAERNSAFKPVDLQGLTLMPGLIDTHVHISVPFMHRVTPKAFVHIGPQIERNAKACIDAGITTVRDAGGFPRRLSSLIQAVEGGDIPGPRIIRCNSCIASPGGCPDWVPHFNPIVEKFIGGQYAERAGTPEEAENHANAMIDLGARWIKIYCQGRSWLLGGSSLPVFDRETFKALMGTAHGRGRKVCCHVSWLDDVKYAMSMGVDTFEHSPLEEIPQETAAEFAARGMVLNPTLTCLDLGNGELWSMLESVVSERGGELLESEPLRQVREHIDTYRTLPYPPPEKEYRRRPYFNLPLIAERYPAAFDNVRRVLHAGGRVGVGTDSGGLPTAFFGIFYLEELKRLKDVGFTTAQVLQLATSGNAAVLGMEDLIGTIRPGRKADMIAVEGNPLEDIDALKRVKMVIRDGRFLKGHWEESSPRGNRWM